MENNDLIKLYEIRALMSLSTELANDVENEKKSMMVNTDCKNKEISSKTREIEELKKKCSEEINIVNEEDYVNTEINKRQKSKYSYNMEHTREYYEAQESKPYDPYFEFEWNDYWDVFLDFFKYIAIAGLVVGVILSFVIDRFDSLHNFFLVKWLYEWKDMPGQSDNGWVYIIYFLVTVLSGFLSVLIVFLLGWLFCYFIYNLGLYLYEKVIYIFGMMSYNKKVNSKMHKENLKIKLDNEEIMVKNKKIEEENELLLNQIKEEYNIYVINQKTLIKNQSNNKLRLSECSKSYGLIKKQIEDKYKLKNNKHREAIKFKKFEMDNVLNELDNCCEGYINYNDLENIDTLIYYISTYRASNLKEALNLLDKDKRLNLTLDALDKMRRDINEQIEYAITTSMKYVDNAMKHINSSLGQVNYNLNVISNNVNENNRLASSLLNLQYRLNDKMNVILDKHERTEALVYNNMALVSSLQNQVSVSSQEMMKKMKSIKSDIFWKM